jgi:hypothetical protein
MLFFETSDYEQLKKIIDSYHVKAIGQYTVERGLSDKPCLVYWIECY